MTKYFYPFLCLVIFLSSCSDDDKEDKKYFKCQGTIEKGTKITLSTRDYQPIETIILEDDLLLEGETILELKTNVYTFKLSEMDILFKNNHRLKDINISILDEQLKWIGSNSLMSAFYFKDVDIKKNQEQNYDMSFSGTEPILLFGISTQEFTTCIEGIIKIRSKK